MTREQIKQTLIDHGVSDISGALLDELAAPGEAMRAALKDTINRIEYAAHLFHNIEHWHGEEAPDGTDLHTWVFAPSKTILSGDTK